MNQFLKLGCGFGLITALIAAPAQAGTMGPVQANHAITPFISAEASWTAFDLDFLHSTVSAISSNKDAWGGRVAGGLMYSYFNNFSFTAETGWSYLGKKNEYKDNSSSTGSLSLDGADLLLGVLYQPTNFGVFLKGGTFFENARYKFTNSKVSTLSISGSSVTINNGFTGNLNQSYILPEVKVGAVYDMERWGVSVAYTHAFGITNPQFDFNVDSPTNNVININAVPNLKGVQVNSVLFGAYYKFA